MTNGLVEAAFEVYEDFPTYKSGVYKHTKGQALNFRWSCGQDHWMGNGGWNRLLAGS